MYRIFGADLKKLTSLGVGGTIGTLTVAERPEEVEPSVVLGRGTNVLAPDGGLRAALLPRITGLKLTPDGLYAGAGEAIAAAAVFAAEAGLTGLEWAAGIPGSVGGAVFGNAGAFGTSVSDALVFCEVSDGGTVRRLNRESCGFTVRASAVRGVVTGACFKVRPGDKSGIYAAMRKYAAFRRATQPRGRTAGSTFKAADRPAGWSLDRAGLKGERVGGAFVSGLHANFIINDGTASAADVVALIRVMKERVYAEFGVALEEEIVYLGE